MMKSSFFQALFEHSSVGIIISNMEGVIEQANPFVATMFGYQVEELSGQKVEILLPKSLREKHVGLRKNYNKHPTARAMGSSLNLKAVKKDGTDFPVEVSLSFYEVEKTRHIVSFINDITERKEAEDRLKIFTTELEENVKERTKELSQALIELNHINESLESEIEQRKQAEERMRQSLQKEKELSEMKSRFVSMASHEFRTPLSGILTSVSLIDRYKTTEQEEKRHKHVQTIKRSVKNLTSILNDFLSIDKLDQGIASTNACKFSLNDFLESNINEFQELMEKGHNIDLALSQDIIIYQDKDMLRNILINLVSNAIKYSKENTSVKVSTTSEESSFRIDVKDFGVGIPASDQKYIFTRFFRGHNVNTIQGTGLGLNIVKRYVELMGGTISFQSIENQGTTFTISLPMELINEKNSSD